MTEGEVEQVAMSLLLLHLNGTAQAGGQQESARDMATLIGRVRRDRGPVKEVVDEVDGEAAG